MVAVSPVTRHVYVGNFINHNVSVLLENEVLRNPSFEAPEGFLLPPEWEAINLGPDDDLVEQTEPYPPEPVAYDGNYAMQMVGAAGVDKRLRQVVRIEGRARTTVRLEGFVRTLASEPSRHHAAVEFVGQQRLERQPAVGAQGGLDNHLLVDDVRVERTLHAGGHLAHRDRLHAVRAGHRRGFQTRVPRQVENFLAAVRGEPAPLYSPLAHSEAHLTAVNGAFLSAWKPVPIPALFVRQVHTAEGSLGRRDPA